jgi:malyl-CoA/(S)-citramalyl-CoA lyase
MATVGATRPDLRRMRSLLSVPANRPAFFAKAAASNVDCLFLDLEDSVFADQKLAARETAKAAIESTDWRGKRVMVRTNAIDTEWGFRDLVELGGGCHRLDGVMVPKICSLDELRFVEQILDALDRERPADRPLELHILVETAVGIARIEQIAEHARRLLSVTFGAGDFAMSLGLYGAARSAGNPEYVILTGEPGEAERQRHWNDSHHYAMARLATACHAFGIIPVDGPFANFKDPEGADVSNRRARALGFQAKWSIHPDLIDGINATFRPSEADIAWARKVGRALDEARRAGTGSAQIDGRLIEAATMKTVDRILSLADPA